MSFIKHKLTWAKQKPLFWVNILLVFITAVLLLYWKLPIVDRTPSDLRFRLWGMVLQLIGAYTVWKDLSSTARNFGKGDVISSTLKWLEAGIFGRHIVLQATGKAQAHASASGRMTVRFPLNALATVEERLMALEKNHCYINEDINGAFNAISKQGAEIKCKIDEQHAYLTSELKATHGRMDEGFTGSYGMLLFGICWLCFGIIFASVAPEFVKAMAGQWREIWLSL